MQFHRISHSTRLVSNYSHYSQRYLASSDLLFLDKITKTMQSLSQRAVDARNALVKDGKDELANIIIEIQKNEEELLIVR